MVVNPMLISWGFPQNVFDGGIWIFMSGLGSTMSTSIYHRMAWVFFSPKLIWLMVVKYMEGGYIYCFVHT